MTDIFSLSVKWMSNILTQLFLNCRSGKILFLFLKEKVHRSSFAIKLTLEQLYQFSNKIKQFKPQRLLKDNITVNVIYPILQLFWEP